MTQTETAPRYIRPVDWARRTGMSQWSAYRALQAGRMKGYKVGKHWFIEADELSAYFRRNDRSGQKAA